MKTFPDSPFMEDHRARGISFIEKIHFDDQKFQGDPNRKCHVQKRT